MSMYITVNGCINLYLICGSTTCCNVMSEKGRFADVRDEIDETQYYEDVTTKTTVARYSK